MSIRKKMAEGAIWTLLEKIGAQGVAFAVFVVIARFVGPEEYGLVSLCYIYTALSYALFSSIVDGVVSLRISDDLRLSSLFWGIAGGGLFLSIACFVSAPFYAAAMEQPRLVSLLHWFSGLPFLFALASVPTVIVTNSMNFKIFTIRTIVAMVLSGVVGITMAVKGYGAYAIIVQQTVLYMIINIIIWSGCGWYPRFMFNYKALHDTLKPGIKMSGSLFILFFEQQMPRLLIGHYLGAEAVGHFSFVIRICQSLHEILIYPVSMVSYPTFARLLNDTGEQKKILGQLIMLSGILVFPCVAGAIVTAPVYVALFFGAKWNPAVPALQVFLIAMTCVPLTTILRDFLRAHNRMGDFLKMQLIITAAGFCLIWLLAPHGLVPMMYGALVSCLLSVPSYTHLVSEIIKIKLWQDFMRLWGPMAASMVMAVALYAFNGSAYCPRGLWTILLVDTVLGCLAYIAAYSALQPHQIKSLLQFLKENIAQRLGQDEQVKEIVIRELPEA